MSDVSIPSFNVHTCSRCLQILGHSGLLLLSRYIANNVDPRHTDHFHIICNFYCPFVSPKLRWSRTPQPNQSSLSVWLMASRHMRVDWKSTWNGKWGTVCDDMWSLTDADVACRQLGFGSALSVRGSTYGEGSGRILMDDVECTGTETTLISCQYSTTHNCRHAEDVGIICNQPGEFHKIACKRIIAETIHFF